jgi:hypothetical protein
VDTLRDIRAKVLVVLKAAPTWIVAITTVITVVLEEVNIPAVAQYGGTALVVLGAALRIITRVTPVVEDDRGLVIDRTPRPA